MINKIKNRLSWIVEDLKWLVFRFFFSATNENKNIPLSIGITTFMDRYDNCLKPLITKLSILFPNAQIIVIANGHVKKKEQLQYLENINIFCSTFQNVELIPYKDPKGLSFIWNQIIKSSNSKNIVLLNDDVKVKYQFSNWLYSCGILNNEISIINSSWSHFVISKSIFEKVGGFDEELIEIGGEDDDYTARLAMMNIPIQNFKTSFIAGKLKTKQKRLVVNSYGKNMNEESHGYSSYNTKYLAEKWETSNEPFDGATEVPDRLIRYWKLKTSKS